MTTFVATAPRTSQRTTTPDADLDHAVQVLRLLADRTRLAILAMLDGTEMSVTAIAETLDRPTAAVSQHLAKLRAGHLVTARRDGTTIYYGAARRTRRRPRHWRPAAHRAHALQGPTAPPLSDNQLSSPGFDTLPSVSACAHSR
ncbi:ArsR/SmtB family transcription factor [Antribacter gilvus]|uniref:ArsR/SmtB family transcription factor n=1 Tax=Antribacter gilvus TaxID=2304675 RepID=UPI001F0C773C|nr:metalloregulator ArsR/SmtB family transcription factor [Antribacter gilvus]